MRTMWGNGNEYSPTMSTTRNVSIIGSITSSGIRVSLLFCMFNVSNEFKFSNASAGSTSMLKVLHDGRKEIDSGEKLIHVRGLDNRHHHVIWRKTKLTHFFANSRMWWSHRNRKMHLLGWLWCYSTSNPNGEDGAGVSMIHSEFDGCCCRPGGDIGDFLGGNEENEFKLKLMTAAL